MKAVISLLVLSNLIIASAAVARDAKEALRDNLAFCSQFVIDDPDPRVVLNHVRDCCALSHNVRDCQMHDLGAPGNAR